LIYIKALCATNWPFSFNHTLREENSCAHFMTKIDSAQGNHFVSWDSPSPGFRSLLAADNVGACFVRFAEIDSLLVKKN